MVDYFIIDFYNLNIRWFNDNIAYHLLIIWWLLVNHLTKKEKTTNKQTNRPTNKQTNKQRKKQTNKAYLLAIIYCSFNNHVLIIRQNRSLLNVIIIGWLSDYHLMIILLIIWWLSVDNLLIIRWILYYLILLGHLAQVIFNGQSSMIKHLWSLKRDIWWSVIDDEWSLVIDQW